VINCLNGLADRYPGVAMGGTNWSGIIADTTLHDSDNWSYKFAANKVTNKVTGNLLKPIGAGKRKCGYEACAIEGGTGGRGGVLSLCFADC
jgi:hypothetical protein